MKEGIHVKYRLKKVGHEDQKGEKVAGTFRPYREDQMPAP